jgi:hypothetical protein
MIPVRENSEVVIIYPEQSFNKHEATLKPPAIIHPIVRSYFMRRLTCFDPALRVMSRYIPSDGPKYGDFHDFHRGYPNSWMVFLRENPTMIFGGTPMTQEPPMFLQIPKQWLLGVFSLHLWNCIPSLPNSSSLYLCLLCNTWAKYGWIYKQKIPLGLKPHNFPMINHQTSKNGHLSLVE